MHELGGDPRALDSPHDAIDNVAVERLRDVVAAAREAGPSHGEDGQADATEERRRRRVHRRSVRPPACPVNGPALAAQLLLYPSTDGDIEHERLRRLEESAYGFEYVKFEYLAAPQRTAQLMRFLEEEQPPRVFAWVHYLEPHEPYDSHPGGPDPSRPDRERYDGEVRFIDDELRRLVSYLQRTRPSAVLILAADHGEEFGEHGGRYHGTSLYEEQAHVPLLAGSNSEESGSGGVLGREKPTVENYRKALERLLHDAQQAIEGTNSPTAIATNAAIIVFREGLEAVLILASLMGSMKAATSRRPNTWRRSRNRRSASATPIANSATARW
mgnify:CR=1 FL=1